MTTQVLWITPILPGCSYHGNISYQAGFLSFFNDHGSTVDMIYYGSKEMPSLHLLPLRTLWQIQDRRLERDCQWMDLDEWFSPELCDFVDEKASLRVYDYVVVDYVWMTKAFLSPYLENAKKIIIGHDIFSDRAQIFKNIGMRPRWFYTSVEQETKGLARADLVVAITDADRDRYLELCPHTKAMTWVDFDIQKLPGRRWSEKITIGYMASDNLINQYSARKFFETLNKKVGLDNNIEFIVSGNICNKIGIYNNLNLSKLGFVNDKKSFYDKCDLIVIPMCNSTGLKIKTLDALSYGMPFLSTRDAIGGFSSVSKLHNFENVEDMAEELAILIKSGKLSGLIPILIEETRFLADNFYIKSLTDKKQLAKEIFSKDIIYHKYVSVTVIISVYNCEDSIAYCLDSVLADKLHDKEIIVIDDASNDNTPAILSNYADKIIIITNKYNMGQGLSRNKALDIARGEFIYIVDGDDSIGQDAIYHLYTQSLAEDLDVCLINRPQLKSRPFKHLGVYACWGCMIAKRLITAHGLRQPDLRSGQDGIFFHMALVYAEKVGICAKADYHYTQNPQGTFTKMGKDFSNLPQIIEKQLETMRCYYSGLKISHERFLCYLYDEAYKNRFKISFNFLDETHSRKIYYMIKETLIMLKNSIGNKIDYYFDMPFKNIPNMDYESWRQKYYPNKTN